MYKSITLEVSLKPFRETTDEYIRNVCEGIFNQWKGLVKTAEVVKVLMWTADGSELLDYRGNLEDKFEWAYMIGGANPNGKYPRDLDPKGVTLYSTCYKYMENPPVMTYTILKKIVAELKRAGEMILPGKKIMVGTTLDVGPEFAKSDFKYNRHTEILKGKMMGHPTMICAYEKLKGDDVAYASYPNGIPDGTPFGTFFGKQATAFMNDIGFDYIWFSNGLGFGREPWSTTGAVFDGEHFDADVLGEIRDDVCEFWKLFRNECPYPVETRGTNMSMGIDYSTDGVPLGSIYDGDDKVLPPPNSPWAAINGDFGLELMGHMSRIAYLAREDYLFRYYVHDPWWANSPWHDRYNSLPHDIYMPMALARIDEAGEVKAPTNLNLLSIDNSWGEMPDSCADEPIPHLVKASKETPDSPSPVVWVYPFDEYSSAETEQDLKEMFSGDWFIRGAINNGLPMSTVVNTTNFTKHDKALYSNSVLVSAVPKAGTEFEKQIIAYAKNGGKVIFYGNTKSASDEFRALVGVTETDKNLTGEFTLSYNGKKLGKIKHADLVCGGGISAVAKKKYAIATYDKKYAAATQNGNCIWVRGTVSADYVEGEQLLTPHNKDNYFLCESLMRMALGRLGYEFNFAGDENVKSPVMMVHKHNNAFIFSMFLDSTTVEAKLKFPYGAPVLDAYDTIIENGYSTYHFPKAERKECRVFVEQNDGIVSCTSVSPGSHILRRRIRISGLKNATLRFFPESHCTNDIDIKVNAHPVYRQVGDDFDGELITDGNVTYYEIRNVTGNVIIGMPGK